MIQEVFHEGELKVQELAREQQVANANRRIVRPTIIDGAVGFIARQPMVLLSSADSQGRVWASAVLGTPGLASAKNPELLVIDRSRVFSTATDILYSNLEPGQNTGVLFIDFQSRRRLRVNGTAAVTKDAISIQVLESYPNCPKYIQSRRLLTPAHLAKAEVTTTSGTSLGPVEKQWIAHADTFFVGSCSRQGMPDVSHRGGQPGFVEVIDDATLRIPDYKGNGMFNTLGNLLQNPAAGLLFIDFETGNTLQLTGTAQVLFDQESGVDLSKSGGTGRFWTFHITQWIRTDKHHQAKWEFLDYSNFNPTTG